MEKDLAIAIDLGASNLRAALVTKNGKIKKLLKTATPHIGKSGLVVTKTLIVLINALLENCKKEKIAGIGLGAIGPIDFQKGKILDSPNVPFKEIPLLSWLKKYFSFPVYLHNECTAAVWGEKIFGAGKKYKNLVYVTISSGIGGGAIVDNHLLIGQGHNAAEVGHFIVDTKYNLLCSCKKGRGHWEGYCSGSTLPKFFKHWLKYNKIKKQYLIKTTKDIFDLANKADETILKFLEEVGQINGKGVSNIIVAYDPEIIILGGAVFLNNKKFILPYIKKNIDRFLAPPKIIATPLKENITLLGATALVFYPATPGTVPQKRSLGTLTR